MFKKATVENVAELMERGLKQQEIADLFRVSVQYINKLAIKGGYVPPERIITENLPWEVGSESKNVTAYTRFRLVGIWNIDKDRLTKSSQEEARTFLRRLTKHDVVLDYNPLFPAQPGLFNGPGFAYRPRTARDEDYLMKIRKGINLTKVGELLWRIPENWL